MNNRSQRVERVERELLEALSQFLLFTWTVELPCYASVTDVEVSPDLRHARVFVRLVGSQNSTRKAEELLAAGRSAFQKHVATKLQLKFCPVLRFEIGKAEKRDDIDILLENLRGSRRHSDGESE